MPALIEGSPVYVQGSGSRPYELKNVGGVYSCSCPAWRNQGVPIDKRTCKHLKSHCGEAAEAARVGAPAPVQAAPAVQAANPNGVAILARAAAQGRKLRQDEKAKLNGPPILLAHSIEDHEDLDPTGWWLSEKLDGVRGYWNGKDFVSRQGNVFHAPGWFKAGLPDHPLDGELWMGRKLFQKTISVVKRQDAGLEWEKVRYVVFDAPHLALPFEGRMDFLRSLMPKGSARIPWAEVHPHELCKSREHLFAELKRVEALGAEGLMIRKPGSLYEKGRSHTLLKVKPFKDAEAVVVGYEKSTKGQFKGLTGSLVMRMPSGVEFELNAGTMEFRRNPPAVGKTVTYRYTELTDDGKPKCTSIICVRDYE